MKIFLCLIFIVLTTFQIHADTIGEEGEYYNNFYKGRNLYLQETGVDSNISNHTVHSEYYYFYKSLYSRIGVFDAGFYFDHEDLKNVLKKGTNKIHYHGTLVSGIIAAEGGNEKGYRGIVEPKYIYGLNYLDKGSSKNSIKSYIKSLCSSFDIFNISLDLSDTSYTQRGNLYNEKQHVQAMEFWRDTFSSSECKNTIFVLSAGNSDVDAIKDVGGIHYIYDTVKNKSIYSPHDNIIIVGSHQSDTISQNYGESIDIYAPEKLGGPYKVENGKSTYTRYQTGTSFAAPQVTGAIALMMKSFYCYGS